jgi:hypothetical protein
VDDMKKRLDMLIDALNNDEVAGPIAEQLLQVVQGKLFYLIFFFV